MRLNLTQGLKLKIEWILIMNISKTFTYNKCSFQLLKCKLIDKIEPLLGYCSIVVILFGINLADSLHLSLKPND